MLKQDDHNLYHKYARNLTNLTVGLVAAGTLAACGSEPEAEYATVQGRLESQEQAANDDTSEDTASSAIVYSVSASGQLTPMASGDVNADGVYTIDIPMEEFSSSRQDLVVRAFNTSETEIGSVSMSREFRTDGVYTAAPMSIETVVETKVFLEAKSSGEWCETCTLPELRAIIDDELAARVAASERPDRFTTVAETVSGSLEAQANVFAEIESGFDQETWQTTKASIAASQVTYDADTHAAVDAMASTQATERRGDAYVDAYVNANFDEDVLVRAFEARAKATSSLSTGLEADARASMISSAEVNHAIFSNAALRANTKGETSSEYKQANVALLAALEASADAGSNVEGDVEAAWSTWKQTANDEIDKSLSTTSMVAVEGIETSLDAAVQAYLGALGTLNSGATVTAETIAAAQSTLYSTYTTDANVTVLTATGVSEEEARTYLQTRAHVAASGQVMQ